MCDRTGGSVQPGPGSCPPAVVSTHLPTSCFLNPVPTRKGTGLRHAHRGVQRLGGGGCVARWPVCTGRDGGRGLAWPGATSPGLAPEDSGSRRPGWRWRKTAPPPALSLHTLGPRHGHPRTPAPAHPARAPRSSSYSSYSSRSSRRSSFSGSRSRCVRRRPLRATGARRHGRAVPRRPARHPAVLRTARAAFRGHFGGA